MTENIAPAISKVLLVDDEENIVRAIARLLLDQTEDLEVLSANGGEQGLAALAEHPEVALILADQRMPGMTGAEFLQKARDIAPDAVRMVLTGYADMSATMDAINKGGAWRYLTKPWNDEVLLATVVEGVNQYRLLQENRALHALVERQNRELSEWNDNLKTRVLEQTTTIRRQNSDLKEQNRRIGESFRNTIVAFSRLIELHSNHLQEHTGNVTELCLRTAAALGMGTQEKETLQTAALLHDIGVIGIAEEILEKNTAYMSKEELSLFLQHAVRGQSTVDAVEELREAGVLIRHHHEAFDGSGFPDGKAGAEIPLGARIIAFADFVDRELEEKRGEAAVQALFTRVQSALGKALDPELFPAMEPHIRAMYVPARSRRSEAAEKELRPRQLLPGMTVTRTLYSGTGMLVFTKGTVLDAGKIASIDHHYTIDPPAGGVYVSWWPTASDAEPQTGSGQGEAEAELRPKELLEGMRITRNLYSGTGLLLLREGAVLDAGSIVAVTRYYAIDSPSTGIFVGTATKPPAAQ